MMEELKEAAEVYEHSKLRTFEFFSCKFLINFIPSQVNRPYKQ